MSGCLERQRGAEANESGGASTFPPCEYLQSERSVAVSVAEAIVGEELCGMSRINYSADPECGSDVSHIGEFSDGRFPLTSTPTGSQLSVIMNHTSWVNCLQDQRLLLRDSCTTGVYHQQLVLKRVRVVSNSPA